MLVEKILQNVPFLLKFSFKYIRCSAYLDFPTFSYVYQKLRTSVKVRRVKLIDQQHLISLFIYKTASNDYVF